MRRNVAILLFDQVDELAFAGPLAVFKATDALNDHAAFKIFTLAEAPGTVRAAGGLKLVPEHTLESAPPTAVLVLPGGPGVHTLLRRSALIEWMATRMRRAEVTLSVDTGTLLPARAGLLDGLQVTTGPEALDDLRRLAPSVLVDPTRRLHDSGPIVTTRGVFAGVDGALHVVARLLGPAAAGRTRQCLERGREPPPP